MLGEFNKGSECLIFGIITVWESLFAGSLRTFVLAFAKNRFLFLLASSSSFYFWSFFRYLRILYLNQALLILLCKFDFMIISIRWNSSYKLWIFLSAISFKTFRRAEYPNINFWIKRVTSPILSRLILGLTINLIYLLHEVWIKTIALIFSRISFKNAFQFSLALNQF